MLQFAQANFPELLPPHLNNTCRSLPTAPTTRTTVIRYSTEKPQMTCTSSPPPMEWSCPSESHRMSMNLRNRQRGCGGCLFRSLCGFTPSLMIHASNSVHRVAVLDVVKTPGRHSPIVLLQPSPRLQDVFPSMDLSDTAKLNHQLPNLDSAYVGALEETGSLFAMTSDRFPLVAFGDANPNSIHPLIDPPPGTPLPTGATSKSSVDEITKARKLRELCDNGSLDPRCLTGIRKLESTSRSRLSRLLDAAPIAPTSQSTASALPAPSNVETLKDNKSLANLLLPWPSQTPGQNLPSNLPLWLIVLLSSAIGWVVIGRRRWKSTKFHDSAQPFDVHHEVQSRSVERKPLVDAVNSEQLPNRLERPEANNEPTAGDSMPVGEAVPIEEPGESEKEDPTAAPTRKKPPRRRRGKKKKGPNLTTPPDTEEPDGMIEADAADDDAEEPNNVRLIVSTPVAPASPSSTLVVSDEILGVLWLMSFTSAPNRSFRFRFSWNYGVQGITTGPCCRRQTASPGFCHFGHPRSQHPRGIR